MRAVLSVIAVSLLAVGCASSPRLGNVIPQTGGNYQVMTFGASNEEALESALHSAEVTCKAKNMHHIVSGQQTKYKGVVSEDTNKALNVAQQIIASTAYTWVPTLSRDDDYQMTMSFTCEL